jgi:hypothetical protein
VVLDLCVITPYSRSVKRLKLILPALIAVLLLAILSVTLCVDHQVSPVIYRTPIPIATITAFRPGSPINNPTQAFVAAQFYLGTTRLRAAGEILPYSAESMPFMKATTRTTIPGETRQAGSQDEREVWLVLFEGAWFVEPPIPDPTTTGKNIAGSRCVYVILDAMDSDGMGAGGIRQCTDYEVRPAWQIVQRFMQANGLNALPGTRAYGQLMKGILLGEYPELTGPQPTLVHNQAELDSVLAYAGQHMQDGIWHLWPQPTEPDIPEALPSTTDP